MRFRLTLSRLQIAYIALSLLAFAVFALPLWYAWKANVETLKVYVERSSRHVVRHSFGGADAPNGNG